jgi:hypothetical protein
MFASDITFGGDATFGFIGDFGTNEDEVIDLTLDVEAVIDDFNTLTVNIDGLELVAADIVAPTDSLVGLSQAIVATDVGAWLGLPVGIVVTWGYDDPDANLFHSVTEYGNEEIFDFSPDEYWGLDFLVSYSMIEVEVAFNPGVAPTDAGYLLAGLAVVEPVEGLNAEVYWFQGLSAIDAYDQGLIGVDAGYSTEVAGIGLDAGVGFGYDMGTAPAILWAWGVGLAASVSMFDISLGVYGNDVDFLAGLDATVYVAPIDLLDLYAGIVTDFQAAAAENFVGADFGINAHIGAVEAYVGYWYTTVGGGDLNAVAEAPLVDGGAYVKFDVDY